MTEPDGTARWAPPVVIDLARAGFTDAVEVGRGGFGVVYRCTQEALSRTVAVKLLYADLDTVSRERFFREGRAVGGRRPRWRCCPTGEPATSPTSTTAC